MKTRLLSLAVLFGGLCATPLVAQEIIPLPVGSWANDVTPDGRIVVGTWGVVDGFIWNLQEDPAPTIVIGGDMVGVSDDGTVVTGNYFEPSVGTTVAGIWTEATGWQNLGWLPGAPCGTSYSTAYDISGDGTTVVGLGWNGCDAVGFRWTEATGTVALESLANGVNRCSAISGDGSAMGGFAQGNHDRTPAFWDDSTAGEVIDPVMVGEVYGFNEDGSKSVGVYGSWSEITRDAFIRDEGTGALTILGSLNNNWTGHATDITEDGNTVVGYDTVGLSRRAWIWTSTGGMVRLDDYVVDLGITGSNPLWVCRAVSDDGNIIVGGGRDDLGGPFGYAGFILKQTDQTWTNLGGGTAGINGVPSLVGSGSLVGGTTATLELTDAPANALMLAWLSFSSAPQSFFGGTIHATPYTNQFLFAANGAGSFGASTTWPIGVPSGTEVWFQFIVQDLSVIHGLTLSNGLKASAP